MVNIIYIIIQNTHSLTAYSTCVGHTVLEFHFLIYCVDNTGSTSAESGIHPFCLLQFDHEFIDTL